MLFISHNHKDKSLVENIALRLGVVFGSENVFYDFWSIQPGEGLIDRMNEGLNECKIFFFFVSENSLKSNMVKLEWQNALMKATSNQLKFIPVRLDHSSMPPILAQTLYIDLFTNGLEIALTQMIQVVQGHNTFAPQHGDFSNLRCSRRVDCGKFLVSVSALYYLEVVPRIAVVFTNPADVVSARICGAVANYTHRGTVPLSDGSIGNLIAINLPLPITPGFPVEIEISTSDGSKLGYIVTKAEVSANKWKTITD